jgi:hypothetical protein
MVLFIIQGFCWILLCADVIINLQYLCVLLNILGIKVLCEYKTTKNQTG